MTEPDKSLLVVARDTPVTIPEMILGYADGHSKVMGQDPTPQCLAVEVAHGCLEAGNGKKLKNFALGNVKWSPDWDGWWCMYACDERAVPVVAQAWLKDPRAYLKSDDNADGTWTVGFKPDHPQTRFRAFPSLAKGAEEQVKFFLRDRYREAWRQCYGGHADAFVRALGKAGYFTANVDTYAKAVVLISASLLEPCSNALLGRHHPLGDDLVARVDTLVTESLYDPARRDLRLVEDLVT